MTLGLLLLFLSALVAPLANATATATAKPSSKPTRQPTSSQPTDYPTVDPTQTGAVSLDWLVTSTFEDGACSGTPFNVTGSRMNACLPLYSTRGSAPRGSYLFSACIQGVSALYQEFSSADCSGVAAASTALSGGCASAVDPNSADVWHVQSVQCYTGLQWSSVATAGVGLPPLPPGMVLDTQFGACDDGTPPVAFTAFSVLKCNINSAGNVFSALYALSSTFSCDAQGNPGTIGYLGTHCSKKSLVTSLSQSCGAIPAWSGSRYANAERYSCTAAPPAAAPTGWLTQTYFDSADCSGPVLSVSG